jgi:hypothetical protein
MAIDVSSSDMSAAVLGESIQMAWIKPELLLESFLSVLWTART